MAYSPPVIAVSQNIPLGGYQIEAIVNGSRTSLLLDTGAAISLLREDTWLRGKVKKRGELHPWTQHKLVGVDGSPLQVHGHTTALVELGGREFQVGMVVVSPLTTEAILGLDFLSAHSAKIDLQEKELRLSPCPDAVKLTAKTTARMKEDTTIPPNCQMEVLACVQGPADPGNWLLEGFAVTAPRKQKEVIVARALVNPATREIPIRVLNIHNKSVTIAKDTLVATLERLRSEPLVIEAGVSVEQRKNDKVLWSIVERSGKNLTNNEKVKFFELLSTYAHIFASNGFDLGRTSKLHHTIDTGAAPAIRQSVWRIPHTRRGEVRKLIQEMLQQDVIQPSASPWASPIVLVKKKDGSTRFCVDYRKVNKVTSKDSYPLPWIDMTLDTLLLVFNT